MSTYTIDELKALVQELGFDINTGVVLLVGRVDETHYQIVHVTEDGDLVTT